MADRYEYCEEKVIIAHDGKFAGPIERGFIRKMERAVVELPAGIVPVQGIYLFFVSKERTIDSTDQYFRGLMRADPEYLKVQLRSMFTAH